MPEGTTVTYVRAERRGPADLPWIRGAILSKVDAGASMRSVAREIGMSARGVGIFLRGSVPYPPNLARLRKWHAKHASTEREG